MKNDKTMPDGYTLMSLTDTRMLLAVGLETVGTKFLNSITYGGREYRRGYTQSRTKEQDALYRAVLEYIPQPTKAEEKAKAKTFAAELKLLLKKYDVSIMWTCGDGSDTHGIYDENMVIQDNQTSNFLLEIEGSNISSRDL